MSSSSWGDWDPSGSWSSYGTHGTYVPPDPLTAARGPSPDQHGMYTAAPAVHTISDTEDSPPKPAQTAGKGKRHSTQKSVQKQHLKTTHKPAAAHSTAQVIQDLTAEGTAQNLDADASETVATTQQQADQHQVFQKEVANPPQS